MLSDEFLEAYEHGVVIKCCDGITRRFYLRIFAYSADYPEKLVPNHLFLNFDSDEIHNPGLFLVVFGKMVNAHALAASSLKTAVTYLEPSEIRIREPASPGWTISSIKPKSLAPGT